MGVWVVTAREEEVALDNVAERRAARHGGGGLGRTGHVELDPHAHTELMKDGLRMGMPLCIVHLRLQPLIPYSIILTCLVRGLVLLLVPRTFSCKSVYVIICC